MKFRKDFRDFIQSLNAVGAKYVVIGGHAVAFHGQPRATGDIDFFFERTPENAERVVNAINAFGFASLGITVEDLLEPDTFCQFGFPPNRIDISNQISGVSFAEVWNERVDANVDGITLSFISKRHLIINKKATGRPQDIADVEKLK
jgi:hypothetical protein